MSDLDRDQIRRDAEQSAKWEVARVVAHHCLALLAELEQAEQANVRMAEDLIAAEARLAKVPALVEALRAVLDWESYSDECPDPVDVEDRTKDFAHAREALAAWDDQ